VGCSSLPEAPRIDPDPRSLSPWDGTGDEERGYADRSRSKKRDSDQNARPITRGGEVRAGIPEVPVGDAREREHTSVGESGPRAPNCRSVSPAERAIYSGWLTRRT
jgi:hypothetical protein